MQVFIEFNDQNTKSEVLACAEKFFCEIACVVRDKNQYWFKPHDDTCYNDFTDWLDEKGIEYENV